ncbi:MAG: HEAT repeat domain-containing protein [Treponemataceae bacterium]
MKVRFFLFAVIITGSVFFAQERSETTVEQEYLNSLETVIIKELASSDDRENKTIALEMIDKIIEAGRVTPEILHALAVLSGEGLFYESRTEGRLVNNYTDVRMQACDLLAKIATEESKSTLTRVALADNDPMVAASAIRGLGLVGLNDEDETMDTIAWTLKKFDSLNPSSSLAWEALSAYERIFPTVKNHRNLIESTSRIIGNHSYSSQVRAKARDLFVKWSTKV